MATFRSPKFIFGEDARDQMELIRGTRCLIITDENLVKLGVCDILTNKLAEFGKEWQIFDEVIPDPLEELVLKAKDLCDTYQPEIIIGLGGGSSIDIAKAVWFLYENPDLDIDDIHPFSDIQMGIRAKCVAIPTTAGTGSEATWASIITRIDEGGRPLKLETSHLDMIPTFAIVDPIFTESLPMKLTIATGMDALAQAYEGLISEWRNDFADACCLHAIEILIKFLPTISQNPSDLKIREKLANAASLAGLGFGNSQVVLGHAIGHSLGAVFKITHGIAVGIMLPYILEYAINDPDDSAAKVILAKTAKKSGIADWSDDISVCCQKLIKDIRQLQKKLDFPTSLAKIGITQDQLQDNMTRLVQLTNESASVTMNPREISDGNIKKVLEYAFDGKSVDF